MAGVHNFTAKSLAGEDIPLKRFEGQVLLIVNTASACGFTPQYSGLEALHKALHPRGGRATPIRGVVLTRSPNFLTRSSNRGGYLAASAGGAASTSDCASSARRLGR